MPRTPNTHSPEEVRRAFQEIHVDLDVLTSGAAGEILVGAGVGSAPTWTTELTSLTLLTIDNITINGAVITSSTGAISFDDEDISTTGAVTGVNVTSGSDPGHTHTGSSLSGIDISDDTNLAVTSPIVLTDDTLSLDQSSVDHGSIGGLGDDDHTQYSLVDGTRAFTGTVGGITPIAETDLATKAYVDGAGVTVGEGELDSDGVVGQVVYAPSSGHIDLAATDIAWNVIGVLSEAGSSGETVKYVTSGIVETADWTDIAGSATLTANTVYYLDEAAGAAGSPDYGNDGGTGDRTAAIAVELSVPHGRDASLLVDSDLGATSGIYFTGAPAVAGEHLRFDFGAGNLVLITEAKHYQYSTKLHGTWKWQGSLDASSWDDIGSPFTLGGASVQTQTELSGNTTGYRYYQLLGISGNCSNYWWNEYEFKIADVELHPGGITDTKPTSSPVVRVGTAVSTTQLAVELEHIFDHGELTGLDDDDHSHYHTDARGDARYYTETELDAGQLDTLYFGEDEFLDTSAGAGDAGKPIKLDAGGHIDATMVNDADVDHGSVGGLADDDHSQYHTDGRAATWLAANHETTYNHVNYDTAYGWGDHAGAGYLTSESDTLDTVTGRGATTANTITVGSLKDSALTSGRIPYVTTNGELTDDGYATRSSNRTILDELKVSSRASVGTDPQSHIGIKISSSITRPAGTSGYGANIAPYITPTGNNVVVYGINGNAVLTDSAYSGHLIYGLDFSPQSLATQNLTAIIGIRTRPVFGSGSAGTVTKTTGIQIPDASIDGASTVTITTQVGIHLFELTKGSTNWQIYSNGGNSAFGGNTSCGQLTAPTAKIHIGAGTAAAGTAPLKLTSGTNLTTPEAGAIEFGADDLYFTITTGAARKEIALTEGLTSGRVPYTTTNGRLTDSANLTYDGSHLRANGYKSSDGSAGVSGSFTAGSGETVTVKDGLITSIV